jgi:hypothetical protein
VWHLWDARNKLHEEGGNIHPTTVAMKIKVYIDMIFTYLMKSETNHMRDPIPAIRWAPPPAGTLMINVDAALLSSSEGMSSGVVIRNSSGDCVACYREGLRNVLIPELAESLAVRCALSFAKEEGLDDI